MSSRAHLRCLVYERPYFFKTEDDAKKIAELKKNIEEIKDDERTKFIEENKVLLGKSKFKTMSI